MTIRWSYVAAAVSVLGLLVWLMVRVGGEDAAGVRAPDPESVRTGAVEAGPLLRRSASGSEAPCAAPLRWRLARIDEAFGVDPARAMEGARQATAAWERAAGRPLFEHDSAGGFPIRLIFDRRQAESRERRRLESELEAGRRILEEERSGLDSLTRRHARLRSRFEDRARDFERRAEAHNMAVRSWNGRGTVPEAVASELRATGRALEEERGELERRRAELDSLRARIRAAEERLRRRLEEHQARVEAVEEAFPPTAVESGLYREAVRREDGRVASVAREIRVYRFDDDRDLARVIAHELGHALGLGHADEEGALMSAEYGRAEPAEEGPAIRAADRELLRERCPDLVEAAGGSGRRPPR